MTKNEALPKLLKLLGDKFAWRESRLRSSDADRDKYKALLPELKAAQARASEAAEARRVELLQDPEYVRLAAESIAARKALDVARGHASYFRITVGRNSGLAFHVVAEADNWADAVRKAEERRGRL